MRKRGPEGFHSPGIGMPIGIKDRNSCAMESLDQLRTVFDPEIPVNVVELGLIYECDVPPAGVEKFDVAIKMTLTAPGCGMGPVLQEDARSKIDGLPSVGGVEIGIVLEPGWEPSMMSEAARLELGM